MNAPNQPLFTSSSLVSGQAQQDDFDFNEVFAEYFSNEFDLDPLNAYTSSMANYNVTATPTNATSHQTAAAPANAAGFSHNNNTNATSSGTGQTNGGDAAIIPTAPTSGSGNKTGFHLPTGGIRTAYHHGSSAPSRPAGVVVPPNKRTKSDENEQQQSQQQALVASNNGQGANVAALAMAHQQAATAASSSQQQQNQQQLLNQQQQLAMLQQFGMQAQQQFNPSLLNNNATNTTTTTTTAAGPASAAANKAIVTTATNNRVALPVGVGIRLGGLGGIAPATAQGNSRPQMIPAQMAATMWGAAGGSHPGAFLGAAMGGVGPSNELAAAERRQRNREHAKRSRVRKKFMLESMQEQVRTLQIENQNLRMLVQEHIPEHAVSIIAECCSSSPLFVDPSSTDPNSDSNGQFSQDAPVSLGKSDFSLMESLTSGQRCFVLSDPKLPDNPIVFASPGFYEMTGYTSKEVLGRNCRFLQGPGTDPRAVDVIRKAVASGADATICLLNYKADGTPFWNQFFIAALRDSDNCIVNYVGVQCEVEPEQGDLGVEEKVNEVLPLGNKSDEGNNDEDNGEE